MKINIEFDITKENVIELLENAEVPVTENNITNFYNFLKDNLENNIKEHVENELEYFAEEVEQWNGEL